MNFKKILTMFLAITMVLGTISVGVFADGELATIAATEVAPARMLIEGEYVEPTVTAVEGDGVVNVTVVADAVPVHTNGVTDGAWVGFAVAAPSADAKMKVAFGTSADIVLGDVQGLEADAVVVDSVGAPGVAFYADASAATPKTYAKLQWFGNDGETPLSAETTFVMDLSGVTLDVEDDIAAADVKAAKLTEGVDATVTVAAEEVEGVIEVAVTADGVPVHANALDAEGAWVGFAIEAPVGATQFKYAFGANELSGLNPLEENVVGENDGVAFYVDAALIAPETSAKLQWFDENDKALTNVATFVMDLSGVEVVLDGIDEETVVLAPVVDADDVDTKPYSRYELESVEVDEDGVIVAKLSARNLKEHANANDDEGYWVGVSVVAPEGATQFMYAFGEDEFDGLYPLEANVDGEGNDGVAFYVDADTAAAKTNVTVAWYDDVKALSVAAIQIDTSKVSLFTPYDGGGSISGNGGISAPTTKPEDTETEEEPTTPAGVDAFADVAADAWYYNSVKYCVEAGLMNGMDATTFAPDSLLTRAMLVTMLYRYAGSPDVVADGAEWYAVAKAWAMEAAISDGSNMDGNITREQVVTMLYRYAAANKEIVVGDVDMSAFTDADGISDWAAEAMAWAVENGIITGMTETTIAAQDNATRAQIATLFERWTAYMAPAAE